MALWYCGSTKWTAVAQWAASTAYSVGDLRRQLAAPTAGNERVFRCTTAGTSGGSEPAWTLTKGGTTNDGTCVWTEVTGDAAYNAPNNFAAPHNRISNALAWMEAGDRLYVSNNHDYSLATTTSLTLTSPGTVDSPCEILCIDDTQATATLAIGAKETVTADGAISVNGSLYSYGVEWSFSASSDGLVLGTGGVYSQIFEQCSFDVGTATDTLTIGRNNDANGSYTKLINCTWNPKSIGNTITVNNVCEVHGLVVAGTAVPTTLFTLIGSGGDCVALLTLVGADLSPLDSGKQIIGMAGNSKAFLRDCKLGSGVSICNSAFTSQGGLVELVNSDSADTNYRYYKKVYQGEVFHETTIVRSGGASDGTTPVSRKMVSTANSKFYSPLESQIIGPIWNDTTGSAKTLTIHIISFGALKLTNAQVWGDIQYFGTSGFPIASFANDRAADILTAEADQATDTSTTWIGTDRANSTAYSLNDIIEVQGKLWICTTAGTTAGSEPAGYATANDGDSVTDNTAVFRAGWRQKLDVTFTPQEKGPLWAEVMLAAATTLYYCPKADIS